MKIDLQAVHPSLLIHKLGLHALILEKPGNASLSIGKPENNGYIGDKRTVLDALTRSVQDDNFRNIYDIFYNQKWLKYLEETGALKLEAKTGSRFISGLSYGAAMHVGFSLHHTYGVPYIPGSSVKGACKAIAMMEAKESPEEDKTKQLKLINEIYGGDEGSNGEVIFLDAFPVPLTKKNSLLLDLDVITPHHTKGNSNEKGYGTSPDIEEPVPVEFAVVPEGISFTFAFICQNDENKNIEYRKQVAAHWQLACEEGFGAKTSSGYGYFELYRETKDIIKKLDPQAVMKDFKAYVLTNKSQLNNVLEKCVKYITENELPAETQKEMATFLVENLGAKTLKKKGKKGSEAALDLERLWRA
ncbi:type III-B CRISPR module RAMP protein Cmr6 [Desulfovibrio gilichinskyi]|uniref:CRISPR-associated protein Cmr6 n=1 Tax=Desulfovibrio gilichinskyi TaxID=1519643 RepID=A0A1X7D6L4_9BACT|nr:type III-B CRISPR module RAMP protein Cmr6 [Desulfovibrio gilichinskyi]SMF09810.1 CRISPR-associated protein Cmr6 [Desulfovibrio gilichinskyi]